MSLSHAVKEAVLWIKGMEVDAYQKLFSFPGGRKAWLFMPVGSFAHEETTAVELYVTNDLLTCFCFASEF